MTSLALVTTLFATAHPQLHAALPPLPSEQKRPLECASPGEASVEEPFLLRCALRPGTQAAAVVLYYRQTGAGAADFVAAPTLRTKAGWYVATLCAHDVSAGPLQYYFEAQDAAGRVLAGEGDEESPSVLVVRGPTPVAAPTLALPATVHATIADDNDPLAAARKARADRRSADLRAQQRGSGFFVGGSVGLGYGHFRTRTLDYRSDLESDPDFGASGRPLLMPVVGWQLDPDWALSVQLRWQTLEPEGAGDGRLGSPATRSWAVIARGQRLYGEGRLQGFAAANLGAGDGFRVVVPARPQQGLLRDDSVRGGPIVVGPSGGALYHLNPHVAIAAEARVLAGAPTFALVGDVTLGLELGF